MTWTLAVDPIQYDLVINPSGRLQTTHGTDEVRQRIIIALLHLYGEYFLNSQSGMPYYEIILGSKDTSILETLARQTILDVPNVISIVSLNMDFNGKIRFVALAAQVEVQGNLAPYIVDVVHEYNIPSAG